MPQRVGKLQAGTLMFAATYYIGDARAIEIYTSTDEGRHWRYSATPVSGGDPTHGLWEPQFTVATDGALVIFWSDETDPCCSQKLAQSRTYDGENWEAPSNTVASLIQADRPGMAVVTHLPSGLYFMSYELCGPASCTVFYRTSTDGWNFGAPDNTGTKVQTASGQYFEHAPTSTWSPSVISNNGSILLVGQVLYEADGSVSANNGKLLFVNNTADGSGPWYTITAPVQVPGAYDNYCPNYASPLLPSLDGTAILEMASDYDTSSGLCMTYFASERWNSLPVDGATYTFVNQQNNLCLDDLGWGTTNNTVADEWNCTSLAVQQWTTHALGAGYFSLQNVYSGLCVDDNGASTTPGNLITLWGCTGSPSQSWLFMDLGSGQFKLQNRASGSLILDDTGGSSTPGTQLEVWTDNGLPPQHWLLQH